MGVSAEVARLDASAQADLVRRGEMSALELVDAAITNVERLDGGLNAVVHRRFERARAEAITLNQGAFAGVPFLVKDLIAHSDGDPFHEGIRGVARQGYRARADTALIRRFREAGLICIGRTNTPELGLVPTTEPALYGSTKNPWDITRSPGGSSGGSAAAVASRMVAVAHGNDGGGSIRIPASCCGLVGLKPTRGRVSLAPDFGDNEDIPDHLAVRVPEKVGKRRRWGLTPCHTNGFSRRRPRGPRRQRSATSASIRRNAIDTD